MRRSIGMKKRFKGSVLGLLGTAVVILLLAGPGQAADNFFLYGNQGEQNITDAAAPTVGGSLGSQSWFTAVEYFTAGAQKGRMLAATGTRIYISSGSGNDVQWTLVAEVDYLMDPGFIRISPSGSQVALGLGFGQPLLVFDATVLDGGSPESPVHLIDSPLVKTFYENYYDFAWVDESHLVINGGWWVVYGELSRSGIAALNITDENNYTVPVCGRIMGASSGIAVDEDKNLYFGIGSGGNRTGEIKVFPASVWWTGSGPTGRELFYDETQGSFVIAQNVLSSAYLGFDGEGNLHVGGGQYVQANPAEVGFAALINHKLLDDARAHILDPENNAFEVLDESRGSLYREFAPDTCMNDTATGVFANGSDLTVMWNSTNNTCTPGGGTHNEDPDWDLWDTGVIPVLTTYHVDDQMDADNDGYLDVADFSPNTPDSNNIDSDGDGYGNIIDADFNNDGTVNMSDLVRLQAQWNLNDPNMDMNGDNTVNMTDLLLLQNQWNKSEPYYNF